MTHTSWYRWYGWSARALSVAVMLLAAWMLLAAPPVHAAPTAGRPTVEAPDPGSVSFRLGVQTGADLASAMVTYKVLDPNGNVRGELNAEVSPGQTANLLATMQTNSNQRYIPVGSQIAYSWTVVDKGGGTLTTPEETFVFLDGRFQWQSRKSGLVTVYWYGGNDANALQVIQAAADSIEKNQKLLRVTLAYPVRLVVYRNTTEGRPAQQPRGAAFDGSVITGGSRVATDLVHIYDPIGAGFVDVTRHEVGHILTRVAGIGPIARIPSWLDEGTAVYSQLDPGRGYTQSLQLGIRTDQVMRLRNMVSASNQPSTVDLFYGQSWAVVKFMVDTYGEAKFAALFKAIKEDTPVDAALKQTMGVDQDGLYNEWRKSVGLKAIDFPPIAEATPAVAVPTQQPLRIPTAVSGASETSGGATSAGGAPEAQGAPTLGIAIGIATLLLAGGIGFVGLRLARKR